MKDQEINQDWERESLKDFVYLCEESQQLNEDIRQELNRREPARIVVIDVDKILEKRHEIEYNPLPF